MEKTYEIKKLEWDTEYFNVSSARIDLYKQMTETEIKEMKEKINEFEFVTIYNHDNNDFNNFLLNEINNKILSDINVHLEKNPENVAIENNNIKIENNLAVKNSILEIASSSFVYSRFINDKNLDQEKARKIYYNWAKNSFNKSNKYFCMYEDIGFLLFNINEKEKTSTIELIAVKKENDKKGIGTLLIKTYEKYCYEKNIKKIEVGTQLNNIKAQRFYQKNGFIVTKYNSIYHVWPQKRI